jgi:hypothetical protein
MDLRPLLEATFPIESSYFSLAWAPEEDQRQRPASAAKDDIWVVLRLICWEPDEESQHIRDVKEQPVLLVPGVNRHDERLEAWLRGLREALLTVMESQDPSVERDDQEAMYSENALACLFPADLVPYEVLELARPRTAEDFAQALLGTKKRLGRMLFPSAQ